MASSRISLLRALNRLATAGSKQQFRRALITGTNATPSSLLGSGLSATYLPRNVADLKTECRNRSLKASGSKAEVSLCFKSEIRLMVLLTMNDAAC